MLNKYILTHSKAKCVQKKLIYSSLQDQPQTHPKQIQQNKFTMQTNVRTYNYFKPSGFFVWFGLIVSVNLNQNLDSSKN